MPKKIEVPGHGVIEVDDSISDEEALSVIQSDLFGISKEAQAAGVNMFNQEQIEAIQQNSPSIDLARAARIAGNKVQEISGDEVDAAVAKYEDLRSQHMASAESLRERYPAGPSIEEFQAAVPEEEWQAHERLGDQMVDAGQAAYGISAAYMANTSLTPGEFQPFLDAARRWNDDNPDNKKLPTEFQVDDPHLGDLQPPPEYFQSEEWASLRDAHEARERGLQYMVNKIKTDWGEGGETGVEWLAKRALPYGGGMLVANEAVRVKEAFEVLEKSPGGRIATKEGGEGFFLKGTTKAETDEYADALFWAAKFLVTAEAEKDKGFGDTVVDILAHAPGFIGEFLVTRGAYTAAKTATSAAVTRAAGTWAKRQPGKGLSSKLMQRAAQSRAAQHVATNAGRFTGVAAQTGLTSMPARAYAGEMMKDVSHGDAIRRLPDGGLIFDVKDEHSTVGRLAKAYALGMVEVGSEHAGKVMLRGLGHVADWANMQKLAASLRRRRPGMEGNAAWKQIESFYHGPGIEWAEERLADVGTATINWVNGEGLPEGVYGDGGLFPGPMHQLAEFVAFFALGKAMEYGARAHKKLTKEEEFKIREAVDELQKFSSTTGETFSEEEAQKIIDDIYGEAPGTTEEVAPEPEAVEPTPVPTEEVDPAPETPASPRPEHPGTTVVKTEPAPEPEPTTVVAPEPIAPETQETYLPHGAEGVATGRSAMLIGQTDKQVPFTYAWVPFEKVQASHVEDFKVNPKYPLRNTREYDKDKAEQTKVILGAQQFSPEAYANTAKSAAEGPIMVAQASNGDFIVLGGNGRTQMGKRLTGEQREAWLEVMNNEAFTFGLPPAPSQDHVIVRILPGMDMTSEAGKNDANALVDVLNPSPGLIESTAGMAVNDAGKVPLEDLLNISPESRPEDMQKWVSNLIGRDVIDRNTRTQVTANASQTQDYVKRLLIQAAYKSEVVANFTPKQGQASTSRLIEAGTHPAIELRRRGYHDEADAIGVILTELINLHKKHPRRKINNLLGQIHSQETFEAADAELAARWLAKGLEQEVATYTTKKGEPKISSDETADNFEEFFSKLKITVSGLGNADGSGQSVMPGMEMSPLQAISDFLRVRYGDGFAFAEAPAATAQAPVGAFNLDDYVGVTLSPPITEQEHYMAVEAGEEAPMGDRLIKEGEQYGLQDVAEGHVSYITKAKAEALVRAHLARSPGGEVREVGAPREAQKDPRVIRLRQLLKKGESRKLSQKEHDEIVALETELGQTYMNFFKASRRREELVLEQQEVEEKAKKENEQNRPNPEEQLTLLEDPRQGTLPIGPIDTIEKPRQDFSLNEQILGPKARMSGQVELELEKKRVRPPIPPRALLQPRKDKVPLHRELNKFFIDHVVGAIKLGHTELRTLRPAQVEGVNRILEAWKRGENFGLFDGTGAGKTMQILAAASIHQQKSTGAISPAPLVTRKEAREAADTQRNIPEETMLGVTKEIGGGILSELLEHVGDISNRAQKDAGGGAAKLGMIEKFEKYERQGDLGLEQTIRSDLEYEAAHKYVNERPDLKKLKDAGEGSKEWADAGIKRHSDIYRDAWADTEYLRRYVDGRLLEIKAILEPYVEAHKLHNKPVTEMGALGRQLAIDLGELNFDALKANAKKLRKLYDEFEAAKTQEEKDAVWLRRRLIRTPSKKSNKPVLIMTESDDIIEDAFARDAEALGINIHRWRGGPVEKGQEIFLATYHDIIWGKVPLKGFFQTVMFDEAHNLRNAANARKAIDGAVLAKNAKHVLYATATPLDKPEHLFAYESLLPVPVKDALAKIGIEMEVQLIQTKKGREERIIFKPKDGFPYHHVETGLEEIFDQIFEAGRGIKREVPLDMLDVYYRNTQLTPEEIRRVDDAIAVAEKTGRILGLKGGQLEGYKKMAGRKALEAAKIKYAIAEAEEAIAQGKQVIIYAYRVEEDNNTKLTRKLRGDESIAGESTLEAAFNRLNEKYPNRVGKLYGSAGTKRAKARRKGTVEMFQEGKLDVVLATPMAASTGLSLDDVYGDRPRKIIQITAPFSALEFVQIAGRIARLSTQSRAEMSVLLTSHWVDRWGDDIIARKLRTLKASVKGDVPKAEKDPKGGWGAAYSVNAVREENLPPKINKIRTDLASEQGIIDAGRRHGDLVSRSTSGLAGGTESLHQPIKLKAKMVDELRKFGTTNPIGKKLETVADLAALGQLMRDPRQEVGSILLLNDANEVVGWQSVTVGRPDATYMVHPRQTFNALQEWKEGQGATKYVMLHNHPSGSPSPSEKDIKATKRFAQNLPGMWMHMVTDHGKYSTINPETMEVEAGVIEEVVNTPDPLIQKQGDPEVGRILGKQITHHPDFSAPRLEGMPLGRTAIARLAEQLRAGHKENLVQVVFLDNLSRVRAVGNVSKADFISRDFARYLRKAAHSQGARSAVVYYEGTDTKFDNRVIEYIESGLIADAIIPQGTASGAGVTPRHRDSWFGRRDRPDPAGALRLAETPETYTVPDATYSKKLGGLVLPSHKREGTTNVPLVLGGMSEVKPVEMPELVGLAEALMGHKPKVKKWGGDTGKTVRGAFIGKGKFKSIELNWKIFQDANTAAQVLAHEIGHLIDFLPDATTKRGNLLGRIHSLRRYMKATFGSSSVKNKELAEELWALTKWWRPLDEATAPADFLAYRKSAVEMYADALSVLLNSPGALQRKAPKFYRAFWDALDKKPEVQEALFDLQDFLQLGKLTTIERRREDVAKAYAKGEEIMRQKAEERELRGKWWKSFWDKLMAGFIYDGAKVDQISRTAKKEGWEPSMTTDPRVLMEESAMAENTNAKLVQKVFEVVKEIEAEGITTEQFGEWMEYDRIINERDGLANPGGKDRRTARHSQWALEHIIGPHRTGLMRWAAQRVHQLFFDVAKVGVEVGAINRKTFKTQIEPNKNHYAPFAVIKYLSDYAPAGVKQQFGTLEEIANPFTRLLMKAVAMNNLYAVQKTKNAVRNLLEEHFPSDIKPAVTDSAGKPVEDPSWGILSILENGKTKYYYVDPFIADAFEMDTATSLEHAVKPLDLLYREIFYPLHITFNPAFQLSNIQRDFGRSARNLDIPRRSLLKQYALTLRSAIRRLRDWRDPETGKPDPLIQEMTDNFAISIPEARASTGAAHGLREDFLENILKRYKILEKKGGVIPGMETTPAEKVANSKLLGWLAFSGDVLESMSKIASYKYLREYEKIPPKEAAFLVRNYAGTPHVRRKGKHAMVVRAFIPFFNVMKEGWKSDLEMMTGDPGGGATRRGAGKPKGGKRWRRAARTAAGWWFRYMMAHGVVSIFQGLAAAGMLGDDLKEIYDGVEEYDKTNYLVIPYGYVEGGDFGRQVLYHRIPRDFTAQLLSGFTYKLIRSMGENPKPLNESFRLVGESLPSYNTFLELASKWSQYAAGRNPTDNFKGRPILNNDEGKAGGWPATRKMLIWSYNRTGLQDIYRFDAQTRTTAQSTLDSIPALHRFIKISDAGYREMQWDSIALEQQAAAISRLSYPENVKNLLREYNSLRWVGEKRSAEQELRFDLLRGWHRDIYNGPGGRSEIDSLEELGVDTKGLKSLLEQSSKLYEKKP